jgi:hypothetical protein
MHILGSANIDWTQVLILGVPAYIAAVGGAVAAIIAAKSRRALATPSGDPIGHVVERTHEAGIANNLLLRAMNGTTKAAEGETLKDAGAEAMHVPAE